MLRHASNERLKLQGMMLSLLFVAMEILNDFFLSFSKSIFIFIFFIFWLFIIPIFFLSLLLFLQLCNLCLWVGFSSHSFLKIICAFATIFFFTYTNRICSLSVCDNFQLIWLTATYVFIGFSLYIFFFPFWAFISIFCDFS